MATTDQDELDRALRDLAHPASPLTPGVEDELAMLTIATMREGFPRRQRGWKFALAGGLSVAAVLGIGATAVATGLWAPWATTPDGSYRYTLPSGVTCEGRVGDLYAENPDVRAAVQQIFADTDVVSAADIAGSNSRLQADESAIEYAEVIAEQSDSPGTTTPADVIYGMAVSQAVTETVNQELEARGFDMFDDRKPDLPARTEPVRRGPPVTRRATGLRARGVDNISLNAADLLAYFEHRSRGAEAADLLSETMVTAWRADRCDASDCGAGTDVALRHRPQRARQRRTLSATTMEPRRQAPRPPRHRAGSGRRPTSNVEVRDAVDRLPSDLQELIGLIHWDGFSITEAAEIIGIPASTARTRYQAARQQLVHALSPATG